MITPAFEIEPAMEGWPYPVIQDIYDNQRPSWAEVTEDFYIQMLEVLPPLLWRGESFMVGEPYTHTATEAIHCGLTRVGKRHFARYCEVKDFHNQVRQLRGQLRL